MNATATAVWLARGLHEPFPLPVDMADKTVLAMKVASETGGVGVMHAVPHTLAAVGFYNGDDALREAIRNSKIFMDHANQTVGKPASYLGINMLMELESRQELDVKDARGKVFPEYFIFNGPKNMFYDFQFILKSHVFS